MIPNVRVRTSNLYILRTNADRGGVADHVCEREGRRAEPPLVQFPAPADLASQMRRIRQSKIEATPFLQSIPVYRYVR